MNILKLFHIPRRWQKRVTLIYDIIVPLLLIFFGFFITLLPIQNFFPTQGTPDVPIIVLFCLILHKYSRYFVPIFFLFVSIYEYFFMIPITTLFIHYSIFTFIGIITWKNHLENDVSFRLVYFYFYMTYFITLIIDIFLYSFILKGYLGFYQAFLYWITNIIIFPAFFYIFYYLILQSRKVDRKSFI